MSSIACSCAASGHSPDDDTRGEYDEPDDTPIRKFADVAQIHEDANRVWDSLTVDEQRLIGVLDQPSAMWKTVLSGRVPLSDASQESRSSTL